jgi:hypothetical protein
MLTGLVPVLVAGMAACSSAPAAPSAPTAPLSVADSSWIGACQGLGLGTYTLDFNAGGADGSGTVTVVFPDAARGTKTVPYSTPGGPGEQQLVVGLQPEWHGPFSRDRLNLRWDPVVGDTAERGQCRLTSAKSPSTGSPAGS